MRFQNIFLDKLLVGRVNGSQLENYLQTVSGAEHDFIRFFDGAANFNMLMANSLATGAVLESPSAIFLINKLFHKDRIRLLGKRAGGFEPLVSIVISKDTQSLRGLFDAGPLIDGFYDAQSTDEQTYLEILEKLAGLGPGLSFPDILSSTEVMDSIAADFCSAKALAASPGLYFAAEQNTSGFEYLFQYASIRQAAFNFQYVEKLLRYSSTLLTTLDGIATELSFVPENGSIYSSTNPVGSNGQWFVTRVVTIDTFSNYNRGVQGFRYGKYSAASYLGNWSHVGDHVDADYGRAEAFSNHDLVSGRFYNKLEIMHGRSNQTITINYIDMTQGL